jgi:hypothetical protein
VSTNQSSGRWDADQYDWDFAGADDAKVTIRAAVGYLLKGAAGSDRGDIVREIIGIVNEVARGVRPNFYRPIFPENGIGETIGKTQ